MNIISKTIGIPGIPNPPKLPTRLFVGKYFWWDFRKDWQPLVELSKKFKLRFDKDLKRWRIPDPMTQYDLLERLVAKGENHNNIIVYDYETEELVQTNTWLNTLRQKKLQHFNPEVINKKPIQQTEIKLTITSEGVSVSMPLTQSGRPKFVSDYVLYGLVMHACKGRIEKDGTISLHTNIDYAIDFIANNRDTSFPSLKIFGLPKLFDSPFIVHVFGDNEIFPHQKEGIRFLYARRYALLADDMGLGKTMQAILAAEQLLADKEIKHLVIVCPVTLQANWWRELKLWKSSFNQYNTNIIPYSQLHKPQIIPEKSLIVSDEVEALKRVDTRRTKAFLDLIANEKKNIKRIWLMSGTPVTKDNGDLWPLCKIMNHPLAEEFSPIRLSSMKNEKNAIVAGAMKTHMLMRKKEDCLNLPEKIRQTIDVNTGITPDIQVLMKQSPDAIYEHLMKLKRLTAEAKAKPTIEFLQDFINAKKKVIVFSEHTKVLDDISAHFNKVSIVLDGRTKISERDVLVQRFQNDSNCLLFCGNIKAAGRGITLTASTYCVFNDFSWLPTEMLQAEDRCHRIGQTGTVNIYYMADPNLLIDTVMLRIIGDRSTEIASFEGVKQTMIEEARAWAEAHSA